MVPAVSSALKSEAGQHQLPDGGREPVASDRQGRQRPRGVHERDVAPWDAALAHERGAADRSDAAGGEDQPEVGGAPVQVVLDEERQQHLRRVP